MTAYNKGDVLLIPFPFSDLTGAKQRPAAVLASIPKRSEVVCMMLTSVFSGDSWEYALNDWQAAGLLKPTVARISRLFTIRNEMVRKKLGVLTEQDIVAINMHLKRLLKV